MKMKIQGNTLLIKGADNVQFAAIKSWNKMKWNKDKQMLHGVASMDLLDRLSRLVVLPPNIEEYRQTLHKVREAVDRERSKQEPKPMYNYPVKMALYTHQTRGANMALLTFGWVEPGTEQTP